MVKEWLKVIFWAVVLGIVFAALLIAGVTGAMAHLSATEQFTASTDRRGGAILEGNWQSCLGGGGADQANEYRELVYSYRLAGRVRWELHLGPRDEFAVFAGDPDHHIEHDSPDNLLAAYKYGPWEGLIGGRTWHFTVGGVSYRFNAVLAGGSRDTCESYFILIEKL